MAFKRLLNIARRRPGDDRSSAGGPAVDVAAVALDDAPLGPPPVLRPAAIFRQLLFDPAESAPVWARPRSAAAPDAASQSDQANGRPAAATSKATVESPVAIPASASDPKPAKRTRRPKASGTPSAGGSPVASHAPAASRSAAASRTRSKRVATPDRDATAG